MPVRADGEPHQRRKAHHAAAHAGRPAGYGPEEGQDEVYEDLNCFALRAGQSTFALRLMFSFGVKREPENHQRLRRAGSTRKGLLAPFRPQRRSRNGKKLSRSAKSFFLVSPILNDTNGKVVIS